MCYPNVHNLFTTKGVRKQLTTSNITMENNISMAELFSHSVCMPAKTWHQLAHTVPIGNRHSTNISHQIEELTD